MSFLIDGLARILPWRDRWFMRRASLLTEFGRILKIAGY